jgi:hypothetical protein
MDGTTRSPADRQQSATSKSPTRAQFHLLSSEPRREPGEGRAGSAIPQPRGEFDLTTGAPTPGDLRAICTAFRIQLDLARPGRSSGWLASHVIRESVAPLRGNVRMRVARRSRRVAATAAFQIDPPDGRWHLDALLARDPEDGAALDSVLRRGVADAGSSGARRVFARIESDVTIDAALRRSGFVPYQTESVFMLLDGPTGEAPSSHVRRAQPADVWGIHQLYLELVPRQVQYAEAMTSRQWERSQPLRPGTRRSSGWVIEDHGRIRAYARVSTLEDPRVVRLDVLIDPELRALTTDLIATATTEAGNLHGVPCVVAVPGYTQELSQPLQDTGFFHLGDQTAWVCYTTVPARSYIVAVDTRVPVSAETQRSRVPGFGGAGMSLVESAGPAESATIGVRGSDDRIVFVSRSPQRSPRGKV